MLGITTYLTVLEPVVVFGVFVLDTLCKVHIIEASIHCKMMFQLTGKSSCHVLSHFLVDFIKTFCYIVHYISKIFFRIFFIHNQIFRVL